MVLSFLADIDLGTHFLILKTVIRIICRTYWKIHLCFLSWSGSTAALLWDSPVEVKQHTLPLYYISLDAYNSTGKAC